MNLRQLFLNHVAQTSASPIGIEMARAEGIYLFDVNNKKYIDGISGFSVANIGHSNPKVINAVQQQAAAYMHLIVYGEFIQQPQVAYAKLLTDHLCLLYQQRCRSNRRCHETGQACYQSFKNYFIQ